MAEYVKFPRLPRTKDQILDEVWQTETDPTMLALLEVLIDIRDYLEPNYIIGDIEVDGEEL